MQAAERSDDAHARAAQWPIYLRPAGLLAAAGVGARAFSFVAVHFFLVSDFGGGGNLRVSATDAAVRFIVDLSISNAWSSLL